MIKNILLYLVVLLCTFVFSIFYYEWFSWYLLVLTLCIPAFSLLISLPFMIYNAIRGFTVYVPEEADMGDDVSVRIAGCKGKGGFCPLIKIKFRLANEFAKSKKTVDFLYSGMLDEHAFRKLPKLTQDCGCVEIKAGYGKVYDMLGIFFVPVKLGFKSQFLIMPKEKKPAVLPDVDNERVIGYKPKPSGFAEEYELREYRSGDSLKNIHWKISAKYDDLVVKEPTVPIYRPLIIKPVITDKAKENNQTFAKLIYTVNYLKKSRAEVYLSCSDDKLIRISGDDDLKDYLLGVYQKKTFDYGMLNRDDNAVMYTITHNSEAVSA